MKNLSLSLVVLAVISLATGCCSPYSPYGGYGAGYGPSFGGGCPGGACGTGAGVEVLPPQTGMYQPYQGAQLNAPTPAPVAAQPNIHQTNFTPVSAGVIHQGGFHHGMAHPVTAMGRAPLESLPTY